MNIFAATLNGCHGLPAHKQEIWCLSALPTSRSPGHECFTTEDRPVGNQNRNKTCGRPHRYWKPLEDLFQTPVPWRTINGSILISSRTQTNRKYSVGCAEDVQSANCLQYIVEQFPLPQRYEDSLLSFHLDVSLKEIGKGPWNSSKELAKEREELLALLRPAQYCIALIPCSRDLAQCI